MSRIPNGHLSRQNVRRIYKKIEEQCAATGKNEDVHIRITGREAMDLYYISRLFYGSPYCVDDTSDPDWSGDDDAARGF